MQQILLMFIKLSRLQKCDQIYTIFYEIDP